MIEINGIRLEEYKINSSKEFKKIEKKASDSWEFLKKRHHLENGGKLKMKLFDKFKFEKQISSDNGEHRTKVLSAPSAIQVSYRSEINFKGTNYEVRYFDTKSKDKDGRFVYKPTSYFIRGDKTFTERDKDLIIYLYLFSGLVKYPSNDLPFTVNKRKDKYYFEDKLVDARNKIEERNRIARATVTLADFDDERLRKFSAIINVPDYETAHIEIVRNYIISLIEGDNGISIYNSLNEFKEKYNDSFFKIEEDVAMASRKKIVRNFRVKKNNQSYVEWWYIKGGSKENLIFEYKGTKTSLTNLANYMASNTEAYELLCDKLNEIT